MLNTIALSLIFVIQKWPPIASNLNCAKYAVQLNIGLQSKEV
jgi:hypothetical protein